MYWSESPPAKRWSIQMTMIGGLFAKGLVTQVKAVTAEGPSSPRSWGVSCREGDLERTLS